MNKAESSDSKLDKSVERTFLSGKNMKIYHLTEDSNKIKDNNQRQNSSKGKGGRFKNETYGTNLYGNNTKVTYF
jgi:hypothetical protein